MSVLGRWRIVEMPDYTDDYPDMMEPAYILFEAQGSGEFAFGCVTGQIFGGGDTDDGTLKGQICFHAGDKANFTAHAWTSATAC